MLPVGTECQSQEITLMGLIAKPFVGEIGKFVGGKVQNCDGLMRARLLRSVAVVQQSCVVTVGADYDRRRKTIGGGDMTWAGECQLFAAGKIYRAMVIGLSNYKCCAGKKKEAKVQKYANHISSMGLRAEAAEKRGFNPQTFYAMPRRG